MSKEMNDLQDGGSRRGFLRRAGVGAGAAVGAMAFGSAQAKPIEPMPARWDETVDVIVVGSGFAGLAAAIEAKKAGASVVVLEKMRTPGGNSIINGGIFGVPGTPMQKAENLEDSPELMADDMVREGLGLPHPNLLKAMTSQALETYRWTVDELGVEYIQGQVTQEGGHSVPRCVNVANGSGSGIVRPQLAKLKSLGVEPRLSVFMERIIRDADGRVKGVQVREGYRFPNATSGKVKTIGARKAVVLAHGGFGADVGFRKLHDPKLTEKFDTTNQPGATAEAWREAARIGCHLIQVDWIQCGPWNSPEEKGMGIALYFAQGGAAMFGVWVDAKTGKRYINELANRKVRADANLALLNNGSQGLAIADSEGVASMKVARKGMLEKQLERGVVKAFNSLDELAAAYGIPADGLKQTVADWNRAVAQGKDDSFGRYINKKAKPIGTAPFYVSRMSPKVHHCMGGIAINSLGQALDVTSDKPIPGLYAVGEAAGGIHGAVRLGSNAVTDCLTFGRIAGQNAARDSSWF